MQDQQKDGDKKDLSQDLAKGGNIFCTQKIITNNSNLKNLQKLLKQADEDDSKDPIGGQNLDDDDDEEDAKRLRELQE